MIKILAAIALGVFVLFVILYCMGLGASAFEDVHPGESERPRKPRSGAFGDG